MGSGAETVHETGRRAERPGRQARADQVRLFRPFSLDAFVARPAASDVRAIAVLDRTKRPGSIGEPLYQDIITAWPKPRPTGCARPASIRW